ncbi:MAG: (d)CMP kinase [Thermaerobacter sp.]|nr:(d)CMP kinase [Thermaerobacter sp.]
MVRPRGLVIAVDGPAGAGKSTAAQAMAAMLGLLYLDTGAMYRALALKALRRDVDVCDGAALAALLADTAIVLQRTDDGRSQVLLDGDEVSAQLRSPEINATVAEVARHRAVREEMVRRQRTLAVAGGVVMDGRDIGTHVLPDADLKFYLTASLDARARRRQADLAQLGYTVRFEQLREEILQRDFVDAGRPHHPLQQAADAIVIDTTSQEVSRVVEQMVARCRQRLAR